MDLANPDVCVSDTADYDAHVREAIMNHLAEVLDLSVRDHDGMAWHGSCFTRTKSAPVQLTLRPSDHPVQYTAGILSSISLPTRWTGRWSQLNPVWTGTERANHGQKMRELAGNWVIGHECLMSLFR
jgi:hypothetical protein